MAAHNDFGKEGENDAVNYLLSEGYQILERNYTYAHAEIDIIALKDDILAVVEVKTRTSNLYGEPESFVHQQKINLLVRAINHYIEKKNLEVEVRFDIISIIKNQYQYELKHLEDAFYPF